LVAIGDAQICYVQKRKCGLLPGSWSPLALQFTNVHLALQRRSIEAVNHLGTGPSIASQGQGVHSAAKHQSEHDAAVAKAFLISRTMGLVALLF
jgi:hypothetical protein